MSWLLKVFVWIFLFPFMLPIWLWRKGRFGKWLAGIWILLLLASALSSSPPEEVVRVASESTAKIEVAQAMVAGETPTGIALPTPAEAQADEITPTDTPVAPATPIPAVRPSDTPATTATPTSMPTIATFSGSASRSITGQPGAVPAGAEVAQLVRVVDGDTIDVLVNGQPETVRYIGIDTPERNQPGYRAATEANRLLLGSGALYLVRDRTERDRYDRLLRYVYNADGVFVDAEMVRQGWAQPVEYPPDTLHAMEFRRLAQEAAEAGAGFWSGSSAYDGAMSYGLATGAINLRSGPGTDFETSGTVAAGTPLTIFGRNEAGEWVQVRTPERSGGWMYASLLTINVSVASIGVAGNIPVAITPATVSTPESSASVNPAGGNRWTEYTCDENPSPPPNPMCPIKGNISSGGQIYHTPGQRDYCRTVIDTSNGERWFCSEAEAEAAGWRAAQR